MLVLLVFIQLLLRHKPATAQIARHRHISSHSPRMLFNLVTAQVLCMREARIACGARMACGVTLWVLLTGLAGGVVVEGSRSCDGVGEEMTLVGLACCK